MRGKTSFLLLSFLIGIFSICMFQMNTAYMAWSFSITSIPDQRAQPGDAYSYSPTADQAGLTWFKEYGPDDVSVNRNTGQISWSIPSDLATESFILG